MGLRYRGSWKYSGGYAVVVTRPYMSSKRNSGGNRRLLNSKWTTHARKMRPTGESISGQLLPIQHRVSRWWTDLALCTEYCYYFVQAAEGVSGPRDWCKIIIEIDYMKPCL